MTIMANKLIKLRSLFALLLFLIFTVACERDTRLTIEASIPTKFHLSGSGTLNWLRVRGPKKQREAEGEDMYLYWAIKRVGNGQAVEDMSPVIYGRVPDGYVQVYPEMVEAPMLIENERYNIWITTLGANGVNKDFTIIDNKVVEHPY